MLVWPTYLMPGKFEDAEDFVEFGEHICCDDIFSFLFFSSSPFFLVSSRLLPHLIPLPSSAMHFSTPPPPPPPPPHTHTHTHTHTHDHCHSAVMGVTRLLTFANDSIIRTYATSTEWYTRGKAPDDVIHAPLTLSCSVGCWVYAT